MSASLAPNRSNKTLISPHHSKNTGRAGTPVTLVSTESLGTETATVEPSKGASVSEGPGVMVVDEQLEAELGKDQGVLKEHEAALKRLEELQKDMIGGEKAGT